MNPELQKELAAWLASMRETAQQGTSFAIEQAPLVVQEKITYGRISEVIGLLAFLLIIGVGYWFLKKAQSWWVEQDHPLGYILGVSGLLTGTVGMFIQLDAAAKAWFAPRLYVIEWLAGFLK